MPLAIEDNKHDPLYGSAVQSPEFQEEALKNEGVRQMRVGYYDFRKKALEAGMSTS